MGHDNSLCHVSGVTVPLPSQWDSDKILTHSQIKFSTAGCILLFKHSKTIQFGERVFQAVLPLLHDATDYCPTLALLTFIT